MKMKRTLSLVLALVMVLGTFGTVFADEAVEAMMTEEEAGQLLFDLEVLKGGLDGDLMLDANFKRQEAVVLLSRLMGQEEIAKEFPTSEEMPGFEDVGMAEAYYAPFLAWAKTNGTFIGQSETIFGIDATINSREYATVLLRVLGYENTWETVMALAVEKGLVEDEETVELGRGAMAVMTVNALDTKMADSEMTLAETLNIVMPGEEKPTDLKVTKVYTENLAEVVVELSNAELVKTNDALLNPDNYRLSNGVKVQHVHQEGDNVILTLVPAHDLLIKGQRFHLTIRNIDPKINTTKYNILAEDNTIPVVEEVEFMGTHGIKVTTSEPIANPLERNFRIDSRTAMIVEQFGRDIILTPYHGNAFDKDAVELTIDILEDFAGYKTVKEDHAMALSADEGLPKVVEAYRSGDKLVVEFDRDVYHKSVTGKVNRLNLGNVSFVERGVVFLAKEGEKVDTNVVEYIFEREIPKGVEITVEGVANHFNKAMEKENVLPLEYRDIYAPVVAYYTKNVAITVAEQDLIDPLTEAQKLAIWLDGRTPVNTAAMTIEFDKDIYELNKLTLAELNARKAEFFELYRIDITNRGRNEATGVTLNVVDKGTDWIAVTFTGIALNNKNKDFDYVLEVKNFSDTNRVRMDRDYLDFQVVQRGKPFIVNSMVVKENTYFNRKGTEIVLSFNRPVDKVEASNANNYYLDSKLHVSEAVVERDGMTVALIVYDRTPTQVKAAYGVLEISPRVKDLSVPAQSVTTRFFELATGNAIKDPATVKGAILAAEKALVELAELEEITLENKDVVEAARKAVDKAVELDKTVTFKDIAVLDAAEAKIAELKLIAANKAKAEKVEKLIKELPETYKVELKDEEAINEAKKEYDELGELQELVSGDVVAKLNAVVDRLAEMKGEEEPEEPEEPEDPENPVELTAEKDVVYSTLVRKYLVGAKLSDASKNDKVEKFIIDGVDHDVDEVVDGIVTSVAILDNEPVEIKIVVDGKTIDVK